MGVRCFRFVCKIQLFHPHRAPLVKREAIGLFNFYDDLRVFLTLLVLNLSVVLIRGRLGPLRLFLDQTVFVCRETLRQMGSNPYLLLWFWLIFAQACGWVGVILTVGWTVLVQNQTGVAEP